LYVRTSINVSTPNCRESKLKTAITTHAPAGGGTANTVPWGGITNLPDAFKQEPLSANASFDNVYKGGVTIDTNGGTTVTCEVGAGVINTSSVPTPLVT
jgi:hypothetical protein